VQQKTKVDDQQDGWEEQQEEQWDVEFSDAYSLSEEREKQRRGS